MKTTNGVFSWSGFTSVSCPEHLLLLHLRQVDGQVVCEPAVSCFERLGLRGLGVPHDADPVVEGLEPRGFTDPPVCVSAINPVFSSLQESPYGLLARRFGVLP